MSARRVLVFFAFSAALVASVAHAAEPSSGTVSATSPSVSWTGTVANSGITNNGWAQDPSFPCNAPACDSFTLEVADSANLLLKLRGFAENTAGGNPGCGIRVTAPDGTPTYHSGTCGPDADMKVTIKNAAKGTYLIDVADSHVCCGTEDYSANATLAVPPPPAPTATPAPPAAAPLPTLTAKVPRLSAKKLKKAKRFTVRLKSSAPLTSVNALLVNKKKKLGGGKQAKLDGSGKLVVKIKRRLRKGTYELGVGGKDAQGRNVVTTVKVRVRS